MILRRMVLRLFPASFGTAYRVELERTLDDALHDVEARSGGNRWLATARRIEIGVDVVATALRERLTALGRWLPRRRESPLPPSPRSRNSVSSTLEDIRYALRSFAADPGFTLVAVLTLSLGIGSTTAIFSVVNSVLLRPLDFRDPDTLVMVRGRWPVRGVEKAGISPGNLADLLVTRPLSRTSQRSRSCRCR